VTAIFKGIVRGPGLLGGLKKEERERERERDRQTERERQTQREREGRKMERSRRNSSLCPPFP
jgi:hypothetical protein